MLRGQAAAKAMPLRAGDAAQIRLEKSRTAKTRLRQSPWHATCITRIDHGYGQPSSKWLSGRLPPPFFTPATRRQAVRPMAAICPGREALGSRPRAAPMMGHAYICTNMVHDAHDLEASLPFSRLSAPGQGMEHLHVPQSTGRLGKKPPTACGRSLAQDVLLLITRMTKDALRLEQAVSKGVAPCREGPSRPPRGPIARQYGPMVVTHRQGQAHVDWPVIGKQRHCRKE